MLEKGYVPYSSNGALLSSRDSGPNKKASGTASKPNGTIDYSLRTSIINSIGEELCDDDPSLGDEVENNSFHYQLNQVTEPGSDLSFFNNVQQEKENGDLLYYGWPEIEIFEDVDKMFRNCVIDNEDELTWFSSSHAVEESNGALKPNFKFAILDSDALKVAAHHGGTSKLNDSELVIDETDKKDGQKIHHFPCSKDFAFAE